MAQKGSVDNRSPRDRTSDIINDNLPSFKGTQPLGADTSEGEFNEIICQTFKLKKL